MLDDVATRHLSTCAITDRAHRNSPGVHLVDPVDEFNASRHVGNDSPSDKAPPTPQRMEEFFGFLRDRIATARKFGPADRDHASFRTLYHAGCVRMRLRRWSSPICISGVVSEPAGQAPARVPSTIEQTLSIVRDLAHLITVGRGKQHWSPVDVSDIEAFLGAWSLNSGVNSFRGGISRSSQDFRDLMQNPGRFKVHRRDCVIREHRSDADVH